MSPLLRIGFGLLFALSLASSAVRADEINDLANQAMEISGSREVLENMGKSLERQLATDPRVTKLKKQEKAELSATLKDAFDGRRMAADITGELAASGDRERLSAAVAAMRDPAYLKLNRLFVAESLKATDQAVLAYAKGFEKKPPDPSRVQLAQRLDAATGSSRIMADMKYEMLHKAVAGMLSETDREAKLAALRAQIDAQAPDEFALRTLYTWRKANIQDLEGYVRAHKNEAMGWLSRKIGYGMQNAMTHSMGEMMSKLLALGAKHKPGIK
ncbi:MAG: hypothetical protein B7Y41_14660 [Hydrogenophilales bacterium 28-61-23]|nr:MAG: hypothetical protein B7Y41_14660 [Hydrogenophilales bacterium 28-61-23]